MPERFSYTLALRRTRENRYTWPVLIGALEKRVLGRPVHWLARQQDLQAIAEMPGSVAVCYSVLTPHLEHVAAEVKRLRRQ